MNFIFVTLHCGSNSADISSRRVSVRTRYRRGSAALVGYAVGSYDLKCAHPRGSSR